MRALVSSISARLLWPIRVKLLPWSFGTQARDGLTNTHRGQYPEADRSSVTSLRQSPESSAPTLPHPAPGSALAHARTIRHTEPPGRVATRSGGGSRSDIGGLEPHARTPAGDMVGSAHAGRTR